LMYLIPVPPLIQLPDSLRSVDSPSHYLSDPHTQARNRQQHRPSNA